MTLQILKYGFAKRRLYSSEEEMKEVAFADRMRRRRISVKKLCREWKLGGPLPLSSLPTSKLADLYLHRGRGLLYCPVFYCPVLVASTNTWDEYILMDEERTQVWTGHGTSHNSRCSGMRCF